MESLVGKTLGHYRLERLLTSSSRAGVYQARDERLERLVAVKVSVLPAAIDQFRREARLTATLDHPNILPIYDFGEQNGVAYLVMYYAAGGSLEDRLRATNGKSGLSLEEAVYYLDQTAAALDYTHTRGILHNNLKPSNLLLRERWLMLGDFGKAQRSSAGARASGASESTGTRFPQAPAAGGAATGPSADMYLLGVTYYQILWGSSPRSDSSGHLASSAWQGAPLPPALAGLAPRQAQAIETLLLRAMAQRPADRPQTAGALAAEFRAIIRASGKQSGSAQSAPTEIPMICPTCGFLNKPQARFCRNDGTQLPTICPTCGAENRSDAKFCQSDGTELVRICPTCGAINPRQASICQKDQTPLARVCPACGFENALRARFCERDGAKLQ